MEMYTGYFPCGWDMFTDHGCFETFDLYWCAYVNLLNVMFGFLVNGSTALHMFWILGFVMNLAGYRFEFVAKLISDVAI